MKERLLHAPGGWSGLVLSGVLLLALLGLPARAGLAQGLPPRPTPVPTSVPRSGGGDDDTAEEPGRITGTVIDQTTGAPAPGIGVRVGGQTVTSDANGNYDRPGLAAGVYTVTLVLSPSQGSAVQGPLTLTLAAGATLVQHLYFRSPARPTASAIVAPPVPTPARLPNTGTADRPATPLALLGLLLLCLGAAVLGLRREGARR